ncbi:MAG: peptidoglycan-binding protein [Candidatus Omnitrophica bacterium]|nr:peptidoglycan-binding protein [Candidatus Omnitrophota bacterium]
MQGKAGLLIAGLCGAIVLTSVGYGMGRRAALKSIGSSVGVTPAGAPLPTIQIEPIQPQEELAAINAAPTAQTPGAADLPATASSTTAAAATAQLTEESARVREVQLALRAAGFDPGSSDGRLGPRTRSAVREFQQANGLEPDGKVGPRTWAKLETYLQKTTSGSTSD